MLKNNLYDGRIKTFIIYKSAAFLYDQVTIQF